jgi:Na+/proline symporter
MFSEDIFAYYGGKKRFGEQAQVWTGRAFVVAIALFAYITALALKDNASIFELAIRFAFSGFAALAPVMLAALFWPRSTKWGALAASVWVLLCLLGTAYLTNISDAIAPRPPAPVTPVNAERPAADPQSPTGPKTVAATPPSAPPRPRPPVQIYPAMGNLFLRNATTVTVFGYLPVLPMVLGSGLLMIVVSLLTPPPSRATINKYFPPRPQPDTTPNEPTELVGPDSRPLTGVR